VEDEDAPITEEFPPEPPIELTDEEIVEVLLLWAPVIGRG